MTTTILIDPELAGLLSPLTEAETGLLEHSLRTEGCRDPLVVWREEHLLLDGHHRHGICTRLGIPFGVREVSLADRRAAVEWRLATQLSRRNLSPLQAGYYRGKLFDSLKRPGSRTDLTSPRAKTAQGREAFRTNCAAGTESRVAPSPATPRSPARSTPWPTRSAWSSAGWCCRGKPG